MWGEIKKLDLASIKATSSSNNNVLVVSDGEVAFSNELSVSGLNVTGDFNISGRIFQSGEPFVGGGGGDLTSVASDVIPTESGTLGLGTASKPWKDLHVTTGTIYLGEETIKVENERIVFSKDIKVRVGADQHRRLIRENETGVFARKTDLTATGENLLEQITSNDSDLSNVASNLVSTGQNLQDNISTNVGAIATNVSDISSNAANLAATGQTLQQEKLNVMGGTISGEILPYESGAVNLGSPLLPFRSGYFDDLIVSADSIQIGPDTTLSATAEGGMSFDTVGTITFGDVVVTGDLGVSGDFTLGDTTTDRITTRGDLFVQDDAFFADAVEITGSLTVDGTASAAAPTQNSHLTTKLYVDTADNTLTANVATVSGLVTNNDTELNSLRAATGVLKTSTDNNATNIASNDSDIATLTTNLASTGQNLQAQVTSNDGDISTLTSNLISTGQTLQTQITSNDADISTNVGSIATNATNIASNTTNLVSTGQALNTDIITVSGLITNNDTELSDIRTATGVLKTSTDNNATNIASNDSDISSIQGSIYSINGDISTLTTNLTSTGSNLQAQVTSLSGDAVLLAGNQTVAGNKTFSNDVTVLGGLAVSGDFTLGDATTDRITTRGDLYVEDDAVFQDAITVTGDAYFAGDVGIGTNTPDYALDVAGTVGIDSYIYHRGEGTPGDTFLKFDTNEVNLVAGGWSALKLDKSTGKIQLNNTNADLDLQVMADDGAVILHTDAGTNRVGIGTIAPAEILEVVSDSDPTILIRPVTVDSANSGKISYRENAGGTTGVDLRYDGANNKFIIDTSDVTNALVIKRTDGKVGIGTATPGSKLTVDQSGGAGGVTALSVIHSRTGTPANGDAVNIDMRGDFWTGSAANERVMASIRATVEDVTNGAPKGKLAFATLDTTGAITDKVTILSDGKVGIGTAAPTGLLDLYDPASGDNKLRFHNSSTGTGTGNGSRIGLNGLELFIHNHESSLIKLYTGSNSNQLVLDTAGKVGIGTTSPATTLDVYGHLNLRTGYNLTWGGAYGANIPSIIGVSGGSSYIVIYPAGSTSGEKLRITNDGKVGIGETSPDMKLHVKDTKNTAYSVTNAVLEANNLFKLENASTTANAFAGMQFRVGSGCDLFFGAEQKTGNDGDFYFANQGSPSVELMRIKSDGAVNITDGNFQMGGVNIINSYLSMYNLESFKMADNKKALFGSSNDLEIFHNGSHSYIKDVGSGMLILDTNGDRIRMQADGAEELANFNKNGSVELFYDNSSKFSTNAGGVTVTGTAILGGASFVDNATAYFGTGNDLRIYHDGNNSFIKDTGTGGLYIYTNTLAVTNAAGSENMIYATENGAVTLYYDNAVKLATTSTGVTITGQLSATTKSFLIDHPTKPGKKLRHGSLEGPENGVYIRGKGKKAIIELPEYWTELVDEDSITVQLTPIGKHQHIYVESIKNNAIHIQSDEARKSIDNLEYYYLILAERKDVNKLTIEE